ncbi:hypothetical protein DEJ28_09505 [Curtobacterium sp. MCPF17_002]|uniref:hypothetical protein n=1 Tax=Curtobacterium sp. MCPF17_002 TaxID=2175645 RepID=UPI000DA8A724|nr:hypothetical protein [Curtobacterium sp. MCPF17_002]WIB75931.1 hypothetical protein DEJ28_09505 [Curtobacterium sp. MCPF17_002]
MTSGQPVATGPRTATVRRRIVVGSLVLAAVVSLTGCVSGSASGSCAGPELELGDSSLQPGGVVRLSVDWMWQTCEDTGGTPRAADDVDVTITPSVTGEAVVLGHPEPTGERFTVSGSFALPDDLPSGDAVLAVTSHGGDQTRAALPVSVEPAPGG